MSGDPTPRLSLSEAQRIAADTFARTGIAARLPSERDQNFVIDADRGERFVLKIANSDESRAVLELQNDVLAYLAGALPQLAIPRVISATSGDKIVPTGTTAKRNHLARMLAWVDGILLVHALPHDARLLESLGVALATVDRELQTYSHPGMRRTLNWDLQHANVAFSHAGLLAASTRALLEPHISAWHTVRWSELQRGLIHGDANDYNVIVRDGRVAGLLDFGDMTYSATVCDLAIALAYVMLGKSDPVAAAVRVITAYHSVLPLTAQEAESLYALTTSRLTMSVCFAALNAQDKSDDEYQQVTAAPAWDLLARLAALPAGAASRAFRGCCA